MTIQEIPAISASSDGNPPRSVYRPLVIGCAITAFIIVLGLLGLHRLSGPFVYSADPIRAHVIDEETGKAIEGAVVVAKWEIHTFDSHGTMLFRSAEAVTDRRGEFSIPAWGPKPRWPLCWFQDRDPILLIFKQGYAIGGGSNREAYVPVYTHVDSNLKNRTLPDGRILQVSGYSRESKRFCYWNGKTFALRRAATFKERGMASRDLEGFLILSEHRFPLAVQALNDTRRDNEESIRQRNNPKSEDTQ